jgi:catechol 2,3-dioxygenase-like lactoylglutathione lyase family enzyme
MIDHIGISASSFERSLAFYQAALAPLGFSLVMEVTPEMTGTAAQYAGFGDRRPHFWIGTGKPVSTRVHVAFAAINRQSVAEFYRAALAAGGKDNGPPGLRPDYHEHYYGAFVFDPDGNNVEAVCHNPE